MNNLEIPTYMCIWGKVGFTGVCIIFLILAQKYRLWELVRTAWLTQLLNAPQFMFGVKIRKM